MPDRQKDGQLSGAGVLVFRNDLGPALATRQDPAVFRGSVRARYPVARPAVQGRQPLCQPGAAGFGGGSRVTRIGGGAAERPLTDPGGSVGGGWGPSRSLVSRGGVGRGR